MCTMPWAMAQCNAMARESFQWATRSNFFAQFIVKILFISDFKSVFCVLWGCRYAVEFLKRILITIYIFSSTRIPRQFLFIWYKHILQFEQKLFCVYFKIHLKSGQMHGWWCGLQKPSVGGFQTKGGRLLLSPKTPLGGASIPSLARLLSIMSYWSRNVFRWTRQS